ncbi:MAG: efflux RND transporter periplasmic adaptor subunit [Acidobacteriota bacterium]|nr:efflux RND transporter periplasmic adaptor subunit [Acidobacteriota bacterium]
MGLSIKRFLPWIIGVVVVVLILLALRPTPQPADFAVVSKGPLQVTVGEEGETRVRERFVVSAPLAGKVLRIELEPGDPVVAGETVLAVFRPSDPNLLDARSRAEAQGRVQAARAGLGSAEARRERAAAELEFREGEEARISRLATEGIVSQEDLDAARLALRTAQEELAAARFAERSARFDLEVARAALTQSGDSDEAITLRSPVDGVVLRRLRESESVVPVGEPLLEVGDAGRLEIVADFLSRDAVKIEAGQQVMIEDWGGDEPLSGRVRRVEPAGFMKISALGVEEQRVNVIIDPDEVPPSLGDGYRVQVEVVLWAEESVLQVPVGSLFRDGERWAVFVVNGEEAHLREVEVGQRNSRTAQVLGGLQEGETVVLYPGDEITDGTLVEER